MAELNSTDYKVAEILKVIANPHRLKMILLLIERGPMNVTTLQKLVGVDQSLTSHNLSKMYFKNLVSMTRSGKERIYAITEPSIGELISSLMQSKLLDRAGDRPVDDSL